MVKLKEDLEIQSNQLTFSTDNRFIFYNEKVYEIREINETVKGVNVMYEEIDIYNHVECGSIPIKKIKKGND